jgi:N-formylglutamate deformylase
MQYLSFQQGSGPLVLDSPHSGTWYPPDFGYSCALADLRQAEDTHVEKLWSFAASMDQSFLQAHFARSYLDLNRDPGDVDPTLIDGAWPHTVQAGDKVRRGMGLVWQRTLAGTPVYGRRLTAQEVARRTALCWEPYHAALAGAIAQAKARHGYCIHLNCHSMPSDRALYEADFPGWEPTDFVVGDRRGSTAAPALTAWIAAFLRERGWRVDVNYPYQGVELLRRHAAPDHGIHSIQLEVSRKLYMDERTLELHSGAQAVQDTLRALTKELLELPTPP